MARRVKDEPEPYPVVDWMNPEARHEALRLVLAGRNWFGRTVSWEEHRDIVASLLVPWAQRIVPDYPVVYRKAGATSGALPWCLWHECWWSFHNHDMHKFCRHRFGLFLAWAGCNESAVVRQIYLALARRESNCPACAVGINREWPALGSGRQATERQLEYLASLYERRGVDWSLPKRFMDAKGAITFLASDVRWRYNLASSS